MLNPILQTQITIGTQYNQDCITPVDKDVLLYYTMNNTQS